MGAGESLRLTPSSIIPGTKTVAVDFLRTMLLFATHWSCRCCRFPTATWIDPPDIGVEVRWGGFGPGNLSVIRITGRYTQNEGLAFRRCHEPA